MASHRRVFGIFVFVLCLALHLALLGCQTETVESGSTGPGAGTLEGPCLGAGGCDIGLECVADRCVPIAPEPDVVFQDAAVALDTSEPDIGTPDIGSPEVEEDCEGQGCFGELCEGSDDCFSGLCAPHMGSDVCTETCETECPAGWSCSLLSDGGDTTYICVSDFASLCLPCAAAEDCSGAGSEDACVSYGESGSFCGGLCEVSEDCPEGFVCEDMKTVQGGDTRQCVPDGGDCACSDKAIDLGLVTSCSVTNDNGTCDGLRSCTPNGLSACDAATPGEDACNGVDDDCDGEVDEVPCDDGDVCTLDLCEGAAGCAHPVDVGAACDDGDEGTALDVCGEDGACSGTPIDCPSGPCVVEAIPDGELCQVTWVEAGLPCDDGEVTTQNDVCDGGGACLGAAYVCEATQCEASSVADGVDCVIEHKANGVGCDDGDPTTQVDICDGAGLCAGTSYECAVTQCQASSVPDGVGCVVENKASGEGCDDGDPTTSDDVCDGLGLCAGTTYGCEATQCQASSVPDGEGCVIENKAEGAGCDDGDTATKVDICDGQGLCAGTPYACAPSQCEDGSAPDGAGCEVSYKGQGEGCDDGDPGTEDDVCDGAGGCVGTPYGCEATQCQASSVPDGEGCAIENKAQGAGCDDGDVSTKVDLCDGAGACVGTPYECAPAQCEATSVPDGEGCVTEPAAQGLACDDGVAATKGDVCDGAGGCSGAAYTCEATQCQASSVPDGEGCAIENKASGAPCDDGDLSTKVDVCDGAGGCAGTPYACEVTQCQASSEPDGEGCVTEPAVQGLECDDGHPATADDVCDGEGGCSGAAYSCTPSQCEASSAPDGESCAIENKAAGVGCDDGDPATKVDICDGEGVCAGTPYACEPSSCEASSEPDGVGCVTEPLDQGLECDDGVASTKEDLCDGAGGCSGTPYSCEPNQCQESSTPDGEGCAIESKAAGVGCDDEDNTTKVDICDGDGVCAGTPYVCEPTQCQASSTADGQGCVVEDKANGVGCDDDDVSTKVDICDGSGGCAGTPYVCDQGTCEVSSSPNGSGCDVVFEDDGQSCDDGDPATIDDACDGAGGCAGAATVCGDELTQGLETCDDGNTITEPCSYGDVSCVVCNGTCALVAGEVVGYCGDGVIQAAFGEACDDSGTSDGDGCDASCQEEGAIVQEGLEFYVDAANPESYSGNPNTWYDLTGNAHHANRQGPVTYTDEVSGAFDFHGGMFLIPGWGSFQSAPEITIEVWAKVRSHTSTNNGIVTNFLGGSGKMNWMWSNHNGARSYHNNGFKGHSYTSGGLYNMNQWHRFTLRYRTDVGYEMYVNDALVFTQSESGDLSGAAGGNIGIGAREDFVEPCDAMIAVTRIYTRALSDSELQENFTAEKERFGY